MSFIDKTLMAGERVVYRGRLHWVIFLKAAIVLVGALVALIYMSNPMFGWALLASAVLLGLSALVTWASSEFIITNKRITVKVGLIRSHSVEILLAKVEAMTVDQDILGKLFNYGTIGITGTGGTQEKFDTIGRPFEFRKQAQEQIAAVQEPAGR